MAVDVFGTLVAHIPIFCKGLEDRPSLGKRISPRVRKIAKLASTAEAGWYGAVLSDSLGYKLSDRH